jgi:hypothetical protein
MPVRDLFLKSLWWLGGMTQVEECLPSSAKLSSNPSVAKNIIQYSTNAIWYGMIWYDMIWYDMIKSLCSHFIFRELSHKETGQIEPILSFPLVVPNSLSLLPERFWRAQNLQVSLFIQSIFKKIVIEVFLLQGHIKGHNQDTMVRKLGLVIL